MGRLAPGMKCRRAIAAAAVTLGIGATGAVAQAPLGVEPVATGLNQPLFVTAPANDSRLFIVEKGGMIKVQQAPNTTPTTFLNLSSLVNTDGERGLLGMTFDPDYASNGRFYVNYSSATSPFNNVIARYTVSGNPDVANTTGQTIITIPQVATRNNHKAGWLGFRPFEANNLYIATGDGGSGNDPDNNAQNINSNLGKILRLNVSGAGPGYTIPAGNPFVGVAGNDEIWAYGLRNPFRDSFDRATGDFYIADVGQNTREEVNVEEGPGTGGRNYGWRAREGSGDNPGVADPAPANAVDPVFDYQHNTSLFSPPRVPANRGSITGGYVYRGDMIPHIDGQYFFADFVTGKIGSFVYDPDTNSVIPSSITDRTAELDPSGTFFGRSTISSFGEDGFGELYIVDITGEVYKLVPEPGAVMTLSLLGLCALRRRR